MSCTNQYSTTVEQKWEMHDIYLIILKHWIVDVEYNEDQDEEMCIMMVFIFWLFLY